MHLPTWNAFRHEISDGLWRAKDALFHTVDALMTETQAKSLPEVTQARWCERQGSSISEALEEGRSDEQALRAVFLRSVPPASRGRGLWMGMDPTGIARPRARTASDRRAPLVHHLPEGEKPVPWGWPFSTAVALPDPVRSWTDILDQQRVPTETTAAHVAGAHRHPCCSSLPKETGVVLDRGDHAIGVWGQCRTLPLVGTRIRLKGNRCLDRAAPAKSGTRGAPRTDGANRPPDDETRPGNLDGLWQGPDAKGRLLTITWGSRSLSSRRVGWNGRSCAWCALRPAPRNAILA